MPNRLAILAPLLLPLALANASTVERVKITGCFTDMHDVAETGDVVGMEVCVRYGSSGEGADHWVLFQIAEGRPAPPVLVRAAVKGDSVEFTLPVSQGRVGTFKGKVSASACVGTFSGMQSPVRLPRGKSYWE